ncbi:MAG: outer membrane beta-barrel protein [Bacteriovoracaceae bacterium]|jgi:outer membrane beta-barrel protein
MKKILGISIVLVSLSGFATSDLEKKLDSLNIPSDKVTPLVSEENLISVNSRYSSLNKRNEITLIGANNFNADSHMDTKQIGATYRFHINSRWSVGARYTEYQNKLSAAGDKLFEKQNLLPDSDFAVKSTDGFINFNTVYGKLRLTSNTIVYFDQYVSLGYGKVALSQGEAQMYTADLGFAFWLGKHASSRIGVKNELYEQHKLNGADNVHNAMGYIEIGYLFGEGARI